MSSDRKRHDHPTDQDVNRRAFLGVAAALAGGAAGCAHGARPAATAATQPGAQATKQPSQPAPSTTPAEAKVRRHRTLGRTGFVVSDIGLGCGRLAEATVVRYAYDRGVNLFDAAEMYGNGDSERKIGEAMSHLDRKKVFIVTKLKVKPDEKTESIVARFGKALERTRTPYLDALYMHSVTDLAMVKHAGFHEAVGRLKAAGKLKHAGISSHGPRGNKGDSMEKVLVAAAEDGRFDVMLLVHNFMNSEPSARVLAACEAKKIGTTLMKVSPAVLSVPDFDPRKPTAKQAEFLEMLQKTYKVPADEARQMVAGRVKARQAQAKKHKATIDAFVAKHGVKTEAQLKLASLTWALNQPAVHSVCVSMPDFEAIDTTLPLSGATLTAGAQRFLDDYARVFGDRYCRHGCNDCATRCPHDVPVSTVMRYAYYDVAQGRERHAMRKYAALGCDAASCAGCHAPCLEACPHHLDVQGQLLAAHGRLAWRG